MGKGDLNVQFVSRVQSLKRSISHFKPVSGSLFSNITKQSRMSFWEHEYSILCKPEMTTLNNRNEPYRVVDILRNF